MNEANNEPRMEGMDETSCNDDSNSNDNDPQMGGIGEVHMREYLNILKTLKITIREACLCQNGWIFEKFSKEGWFFFSIQKI